MSKTKILQSIVCAGAFLAFSAFLILYAIPSQIEIGTGLASAEQGANSRTFPYFAAGMMGAAAVGEIIKNVILYLKFEKTEKLEKIDLSREIRSFIILGLCLIYAWLFDVFGYLISTFVVMPLALFTMGSRKWQHYLSVYVVAVLMYFIFRFVLNVQLP